jgi:hypothetical protein
VIDEKTATEKNRKPTTKTRKAGRPVTAAQKRKLAAVKKRLEETNRAIYKETLNGIPKGAEIRDHLTDKRPEMIKKGDC